MSEDVMDMNGLSEHDLKIIRDQIRKMLIEETEEFEALQKEFGVDRERIFKAYDVYREYLFNKKTTPQETSPMARRMFVKGFLNAQQTIVRCGDE